MTRKTAIITGGAGGLGKALDDLLRSRGWTCVLIDLPGPAMDALQELPDRRLFRCDLTDRPALEELCGKIAGLFPSIDLVIYNAGITCIGPFEELGDTTHRKVFDINYFAAVDMARALQRPVRQARGTHLAISSVAGFTPLRHRTAYSASKHALEGFFKSLRSEEKAHGVRCIIAAPSFVATNIGRPDARPDGTARPGSASDGVDYMEPKDAAAQIINGYENGRNFIPVGRVASLAWLVNRLSPARYEKLMERKFR